MSSMQIYNLNNVIQENQLEYLKLATDFAKSAAKDSATQSVPFQSLLFLMRDWINPDEFSFGLEGGNEYLKEVMTVRKGQNSEMRMVRENIHSSFEEISCYLMPHPGSEMIRSVNYDGSWSKMDSEFRHALSDVIAWLLKPSNLKIKKIDGNALTAREFKLYMDAFLTVFDSREILDGQVIYKMIANSRRKISIQEYLEIFEDQIEIQHNFATPNFLDNLEHFFDSAKLKVLKQFKSLKNINNEVSEELEEEMDKKFAAWKRKITAEYMKYTDKRKNVSTKSKPEAEALSTFPLNLLEILFSNQKLEKFTSFNLNTSQSLGFKPNNFEELQKSIDEAAVLRSEVDKLKLKLSQLFDKNYEESMAQNQIISDLQVNLAKLDANIEASKKSLDSCQTEAEKIDADFKTCQAGKSELVKKYKSEMDVNFTEIEALKVKIQEKDDQLQSKANCDVDHCLAGTHKCDKNADCNYLSGILYECKCMVGFAGDGFTCGTDSDLDGSPDFDLSCTSSSCKKDNCPSVPVSYLMRKFKTEDNKTFEFAELWPRRQGSRRSRRFM